PIARSSQAGGCSELVPAACGWYQGCVGGVRRLKAERSSSGANGPFHTAWSLYFSKGVKSASSGKRHRCATSSTSLSFGVISPCAIFLSLDFLIVVKSDSCSILMWVLDSAKAISVRTLSTTGCSSVLLTIPSSLGATHLFMNSSFGTPPCKLVV